MTRSFWQERNEVVLFLKFLPTKQDFPNSQARCSRTNIQPFTLDFKTKWIRVRYKRLHSFYLSNLINPHTGITVTYDFRTKTDYAKSRLALRRLATCQPMVTSTIRTQAPIQTGAVINEP